MAGDDFGVVDNDDHRPFYANLKISFRRAAD
jgi:hypothetical protein